MGNEGWGFTQINQAQGGGGKQDLEELKPRTLSWVPFCWGQAL